MPYDFDSAGATTEMLDKAEKAQAHRGPDGTGMTLRTSGIWQIGLGHQRLAIIDLSPKGAQPLELPDDGAILTFNGEIYNYLELRGRLKAEGVRFDGQSDTEVLAAAIRAWGIDRALASFNGMWAFAWFDPRSRRLILARDRAGIKPLYYRLGSHGLRFSSEVKGILAMSGDRYGVTMSSARAFLAQSLLDTDTDTLFDGISGLAPGHYLTLDLAEDQLIPDTVCYWTPPTQVEPIEDESTLFEEVRAIFHDAVRLRLRSDVPVAVLVSGGVDSTAIACSVTQAARRGAVGGEVAMLGAVSADKRFDESPFIDAVGRFLGRPVMKVPIDLRPEDALRLLQRATWHNDQPIGNFSNVAHLQLMEAARDLGTTVILSGQGADELLCGYKKYVGFYGQALLRNGRPFAAGRLLIDTWRQGTVLRQFSLTEARRYLPSWTDHRTSILGPALAGISNIPVGLPAGMTINERQSLDLQSLSVPQYTHYEDRMSMACGREVRLPFLDVRLIEKLIPLAVHHKLRHGWTKFVFRKALQQDMPPEITWRRDKQGFTGPQSAWLHGPLRSSVLDYFEPDALIFRHGFVDRSALIKKYLRYCEAPIDKSRVGFREIFNPLALEVWLQAYRDYIR